MLNGKSYIGLTTRTIEKRWKEHLNFAKFDWGCDHNTVLSKAIRKYSPDSWKVYKLDETDNLEHLKMLEIYYISKYHTCISDPLCNGYNSTKGGDTGSDVSNIPVVLVEILSGKIVKRFRCMNEANRAYKTRCESCTKDGIYFPASTYGFCVIPEHILKNKSVGEIIEYINNRNPVMK